MRPLRLLLLAILAGSAWVHAAETRDPLEPPPPPKQSALDSLTMPQQRAAREQWRVDYKAWEQNLTAEQKTTIKRRAREARQRSSEQAKRAERLPLPEDGYVWRQTPQAQSLAPEAMEQLARDKIAYGPSVKQSFTPYLSGPVFITSDSLLNGFHVLLEDSFREHELRQCTVLRAKLEAVLTEARKQINEPPPPVSALASGWRQAQIVAGPALCLLGTPLESFDAEVRPEIQAQVSKIRAAEAVELPEWLAPATRELPSIDYRRCRLVGFYAGEARLADYFRAVRWLQMIPFRAERDVELAAIGILGSGVSYQEAGGYFDAYRVLLGASDGLGLPDAASNFRHFIGYSRQKPRATILADSRRYLLREVMPWDEFNELAPDERPPNFDALIAKVQFRILPPYAVPDAVLFQHLADMNIDPDGRAIAVMLGSSFVRGQCPPAVVGALEATIAEMSAASRPGRRGRDRTLDEEYLDVLRTQFLPPPPDAPDFMRGEAWQAKSTQTALAGWAQLRHTFTLQAKVSQIFLGLHLVPPGFVEPNPEFFGRMADLADRARTLLDGDRARWALLATMARRLEALAHKQLRRQPWTPAEEEFLRRYGEKLALIMGYEGNSYLAPKDDAPRCVEVHRNQPKDAGLTVGVGRPRLIHVLYPWNGMEILCTGSVMPYYEYATHQRLTDEEWKQRLDSAEAPSQPGWLRQAATK